MGINAVSGIFKHKDKYLVMYHTKSDMWVFPCGKIENDEDHITALRREMMEELLVIIIRIKPLAVITLKSDYDESNYDMYFYVLESYIGDPINNEPEKCKELKWLTKEEIKKLDKFIDYDILNLL